MQWLPHFGKFVNKANIDFGSLTSNIIGQCKWRVVRASPRASLFHYVKVVLTSQWKRRSRQYLFAITLITVGRRRQSRYRATNRPKVARVNTAFEQARVSQDGDLWRVVQYQYTTPRTRSSGKFRSVFGYFDNTLTSEGKYIKWFGLCKNRIHAYIPHITCVFW